MTSINNMPGQDLFMAALKQVDPEQKKQMCRKLKEMFPAHPMIAKIAKVSHLLNWLTTERMIVNSQIEYLQKLSTPEIGITALLWESHMGNKEIERGNLLLFRILDSSYQFKLKSKFVNHLIEKNDTLGLSASSLAFMQANGLWGLEGHSDGQQASNLYNQVLSDKHALPELIAEAKYGKACLLRQGAPIDTSPALDLYAQVIEDKHASPDVINRAKFHKAYMLRQYHGGQGLQVNQAEALELVNQLLADPNTRPEFIAAAKYQKVIILSGSSAPSIIILKAAYETRNTSYWQNTLTFLREKHGGENLSSLTINTHEERLYLMLLLEEPETIINHLREHGRPPQRFGGGMKNFLICLLNSDLPNLIDFQIQVLEALRTNYRSLEKFQFDFKTEEILSKICYQAAQQYAEKSNHELTHWFYEQIPFSSSKYAEGLEGAFILHSNLALLEKRSSLHHYRAIKYIKTKIVRYSYHLRVNKDLSQSNIITSLIRQIDEIKRKAKKELETQTPAPSLISEQISELMEKSQDAPPLPPVSCNKRNNTGRVNKKQKLQK